MNRGAVGEAFQPACCVAEELLYDALLADLGTSQNFAQFAWVVEVGRFDAGQVAAGVERQVDRFLVVFEEDFCGFTTAADGIEFFEAEADGVDECVAAGTGGRGEVDAETLFVGEGFVFSKDGQVSVDAWGWGRYVLAEQLFAHEEAAGGGGCVVGLGGAGKE